MDRTRKGYLFLTLVWFAILIMGGVYSDYAKAAEAIIEGVGTLHLSYIPPTENADGSDLTDLAGYKYYWGPRSRTYIDSFVITDETITEGDFQITVIALVTQYFVALTALDDDGNESVFSNEVLKTITVSVTDNMPPDAPVLIDVDFIFGGCVVTNDASATCTIE